MNAVKIVGHAAYTVAYFLTELGVGLYIRHIERRNAELDEWNNDVKVRTEIQEHLRRNGGRS